ncbi:MAG: hypothetical protein V2A34_10065 [Lentisphaerota bacterium]
MKPKGIIRNIWLVDTTLRDGLQAPGFALSSADKMLLADELEALGLPELEAGFPGAGEQESLFIRRLVQRRFASRLTCWCRAIPSDVESAARCETPSVHISFPVSERLLRVFNKDLSWMYQTLKELIHFAKSQFQYVSIGMQDASRADRAILADFTDAVVAEGDVRLRVADSVGILTPAGTAGLIGFIRRRAPHLDIDFHAHNDLGMATANSIAAVEAGATSVNITINGIGERAGNARLEEVAVALNLGLGILTGINERRLVHASQLVARLSRRPLAPDKPISGEQVFTHESGIHGAAQIMDSLAYQPFPASYLGRSEQPFRASALTGKTMLRHFLKAHDIYPTVRQCSLFVKIIKNEASRQKRSFEVDELLRLWRQFSSLDTAGKELR